MEPVRYLFLFTPNNSGTTVMCQYLAAQTGGYLPPFGNNEGQMAPAVRAMMRTRPWDPDSRFDWGFIHGEWDRLARAAGKALFIEGSPPNLMRVDAIRAEFGELGRYACSLPHPYMQVASGLYNYYSPETANPRALARQWLDQAAALAAALDRHPGMALVRYEDFCADPGRLNAAYGLPVVEGAVIAGKWNTRDTAIRNAAARTIGFLTADEIDRIAARLAPAEALLARFGYDLEAGAACLARLSEQTDLFAEGIERRHLWEANGGRSPRPNAAKPAGA